MVCSKFWEFEQKVDNFNRKYTIVDRQKNNLKMALKSGIVAEKRTIYNCVFDGKCRKKGVYTNVFWWKISKNNVDSMVVKMLSFFFQNTPTLMVVLFQKFDRISREILIIWSKKYPWKKISRKFCRISYKLFEPIRMVLMTFL